MPRITSPDWTPKYRHHKPSGRAVVTIDGRQIYLGAYGSPESRAEYKRIVGLWLANRAQPSTVTFKAAPAAPDPEFTVAELIAAYWAHAQAYYRKDGEPTHTAANIKLALGWLRRLYGRRAAAAFGPQDLKALRNTMVAEADEKGRRRLSRRTCNYYVALIKQAFRWGVSEGLVPPSVHQGLAAVDGLRAGRTDARETEPVAPVADAVIEATLPHLAPVVRAMVLFERLTGARPGEVCVLRTGDLDTSGPVWMYRPARHKGQHHGRARVVMVGPRAQEVLKPYLSADLAAFVFSPRIALAELAAARPTHRRPGQRPNPRRSGRTVGDRYTPDSYRKAIARACEKAGVPEWSPNQLRHTAATEVRKAFGLEGAQVVLGHARADVTQIYAEKNVEAAARIALAVG